MSSELAHLPLPLKLLHWAGQRPDAVALRQKDFGIWQPLTWAGYAEAARQVAAGWVALGLPAGAHVAVISENRQEWVFTQLGNGLAGLVTVGVYPTSPAAEVAYLLQASDAVAVVCEDQEQLDKVLEARDRLPQLQHLVVVDPKGLRHYTVPGLLHFEALRRLGQTTEREEVARRSAGLSEADIALMIFTSGSTGRPKAAMLSYGNVNAMTAGAMAIFRCTPADSMLSYLPLCHVAEQIFTVDLPLASGAVVHFSESLRTVQTDLREVAPTIFLGVPRIWEKMHAAIDVKLREAGPLRRALVRRALAAVDSFAWRPRASWSAAQKLRYALAWWGVLRALTNFLGLRRCRRALSGAAPISPELLRFMRVLGVEITEGYGMTECAGLATVQPDRGSPLGTVGVPIPGLELRLAEDGELLMRGPTVFRGYYKNPQATAEAIDADGWLHTGDVGTVDADGYFRITDRMKDIIITAGGKNVTPSEIENELKFSPYITDAVVIGDKRAYLTALIMIDQENVEKYAQDHDVPFSNYASLTKAREVQDLIQAELDRVNAKFARVEQVKQFRLLETQLTAEDEELTPTMKLKRSFVQKKYAPLIESMYRGA